MSKKIWLSLTVAALFVTGFTTLVAAGTPSDPIPGKCGYGNYPADCNDNSCPGCTTIIAMAHQGTCTATGGGWDFAGTAYDGGSINGGTFPKLRFWEYDNFNSAFSGCQRLDTPGLTWIRNGDGDMGCTGYANMWYGVQTNWNCPGCTACPANPTTVRTVFEFSEDGWYLIMTAAKSGPFLSLSSISNGTGSSSNITPVNDIPTPTAAQCIDATTDAGWWHVNITLPAEPPSYHDAAFTGSLIDRAGIVYATTNPTGNEPGQYTGWAADPGTLDDSVPYLIDWGATTEVVVADPGVGNRAYVGVMIHYADTSAALPNFLGTWTVSDPLQVTECGDVPAVEWGNYSATLTSEGVLVEWTTLSEIDTLGFYVEKGASFDQAFSPIPGGTVEARYPGFRYSYLDRDYVPGTRPYYAVVEITPEGANDRTPVFTFEASDSRSTQRSRGEQARSR